MPFVRHELGKRLRIRRIPDLHVHLDDSAERATRVLHLLDELEQGAEPGEIAPINESLPTPVKRLPHEGDAELPGEPAPAAPKRKPARRPSSHRGPGGRTAGRGKPPSTPRRQPKKGHG